MRYIRFAKLLTFFLIVAPMSLLFLTIQAAKCEESVMCFLTTGLSEGSEGQCAKPQQVDGCDCRHWYEWSGPHSSGVMLPLR